jgi:hypothetical protein
MCESISLAGFILVRVEPNLPILGQIIEGIRSASVRLRTAHPLKHAFGCAIERKANRLKERRNVLLADVPDADARDEPL